MDFQFTILYQRDEAGWWIAEIPEIPGAFSQGKTQEEARFMVLDAVNELTLARRERATKQTQVVSSESIALAS